MTKSMSADENSTCKKANWHMTEIKKINRQSGRRESPKFWDLYNQLQNLIKYLYSKDKKCKKSKNKIEKKIGKKIETKNRIFFRNKVEFGIKMIKSTSADQ